MEARDSELWENPKNNIVRQIMKILLITGDQKVNKILEFFRFLFIFKIIIKLKYPT